MKIAGRPISHGSPVYVIAEIGVNHDGDPHRASALVRLAAKAGADAVKLQLFTADGLMSGSHQLAGYQRDAGESDAREMLRRLELTPAAMMPAARAAAASNVAFILSAFSPKLVPAAVSLGAAALKAASPDIVHEPLLRTMASTGLPLLVSTGAATLNEARRAIAWTDGAPGGAAAFQCVSSYPVPEDDASLGAIATLRRELRVPVGYSDHTDAEDTGALAVAAGACILEKHFTDDTKRTGPDHRASLDPPAFARYTAFARRAHRMLSGTEKAPLPCEMDVRRVSRQSIVSAEPIASGTPITKAALTYKRPGTGLAPWQIHGVLGRTAARDIPADRPLTEDDLSPPPQAPSP